MARPTLEQIRQAGDFATVFRWNLLFASFPSAVANPPTVDQLNLRCETTEIPKSDIQNTEIRLRGHKVNQPSYAEYAGTLNITFIETVDMVVHRFFRSWREALHATNTGVSAGPSSALKCEILINQLDNQDREIWQYKLIGCYLQSPDYGQLDGASTDAQRLSMTISYDYFSDRSL